MSLLLKYFSYSIILLSVFTAYSGDDKSKDKCPTVFSGQTQSRSIDQQALEQTQPTSIDQKALRQAQAEVIVAESRLKRAVDKETRIQREVDLSERRVQKVEDELKQVQENLKKLKRQHQEAVKQEEELKATNPTSPEALQAGRDVDRLKNKVEILEGREQWAKQLTQDKKKEAQEVGDKLKKAQADIEGGKKLLEEAEFQVRVVAGEVEPEDVIEHTKKLQKKLEEEKLQVQQLSNKLNDRNQKVKKAQRKAGEAKDQLQLKKDELRKVEADITIMEFRLKRVVNDEVNTQRVFDALKKRFQKSDSDLKQIQENLQELKSQLKEAISKEKEWKAINPSSPEALQAGRDIDSLEYRIKVLEKRRKWARNFVSDNEADIKEFSPELKEDKRKVKEMRSQFQTVTRRAKRLQEAIGVAERRIQEAEKRLGRETEEAHKVKQKLQLTEQKAKMTQKTIDRLAETTSADD